jgi:hypothetical protein
MRSAFQSCCAAAVLLAGCTADEVSPGVRIDDAGFRREAVGASPADLPGRGFDASLRRTIEADLAGDARPERIVEGADRRAIEVHDPATGETRVFDTTHYVTDLAVVPAGDAGKQHLVVYTYPNADGGGTYRVMTGGFEVVAQWDETPPPEGLAVGEYQGRAALYYLQAGRLVVRSANGEPIARLPAPESEAFRARAVLGLRDGRVVLLASGDGYTPYHLVAVYGPDGRLMFLEVADEHAFAVDADASGDGFIVSARSTRWRYTGSRAPGR